jgi:hypothetical protein
LVTTAGIASADEEGAGAELGVRSGYSLPLGKTASNGTDVSDLVTGTIPLWFDLGYRFTPHWMVGAYFAYGFGLLGSQYKDGCDVSGASCNVHDMRLGGQVHYHFRPQEDLDPWIGAGLGYEWLSTRAEGGGQGATLTLKGLEFLNLQAGLDFLLGDDKSFGLGPFVAMSFAQYGSGSCSIKVAGTTTDCGGDIDSTVHEWFTVGVRGVFVQ